MSSSKDLMPRCRKWLEVWRGYCMALFWKIPSKTAARTVWSFLFWVQIEAVLDEDLQRGPDGCQIAAVFWTVLVFGMLVCMWVVIYAWHLSFFADLDHQIESHKASPCSRLFSCTSRHLGHQDCEVRQILIDVISHIIEQNKEAIPRHSFRHRKLPSGDFDVPMRIPKLCQIHHPEANT